MLSVGLDFAHIPLPDKFRLIDCLQFQTSPPLPLCLFVLSFLKSTVLERDTIGKEYMMYVCVYLKYIGWDFTYLLDLDIHLLLIQIYYCTYKFIIAKVFTLLVRYFIYSVILNIHHMEERFK